MKSKKYLVGFIISLTASSICAGLLINTSRINRANADTTNNVYDDPLASLGYGYNVVGGKVITDVDSLNYSHPILDMKSSVFEDKIKVVSNTKTDYTNNSFRSAKELIEEYGKVVTGGFSIASETSASGAYVLPTGTIAASANVNISAMFDTSKNTSWGSKTVQTEEYSYYSIIARKKSVYIQNKLQDLRTALTADFKADLYAVKSESDARSLFSDYGTHLLTGYILGGIFEMTNYYATNSSAYNRKETTSFSQQVQAGISATASYQNSKGNASIGGSTSLSGDEKYSFTQMYGTSDNNEHAVNNYKCTTYGGEAFPGLTIDQAFSFYQNAFNSGYMYDVWTDSINSSKGLVIVDVPQSAKPVPLWDLLPSTTEYDATRQYLLNAYITMCGNQYKNFKLKYPTAYVTDKENEEIDQSFIINAKGYDYLTDVGQNTSEKKYRNSYVSITNADSVDAIRPGSVIAMDYEEGATIGKPCSWKISSSSSYVGKITMMDSSTGVVKVQKGCPDNFAFSLQAFCGDSSTAIYTKRFKVSSSNFSGGDGSELSPYIIENKDQFRVMCELEPSGENHYKIINDLDFSSDSELTTIGSVNSPFKGVIDGDYHTITLPKSQAVSSNHFGFINYNSGTLKNINFKGANGGSYLSNFSDVETYVSDHKWSIENNSVSDQANINEEQENFYGIVVGQNNEDGIISNVSVEGVNLIIDGGQSGVFNNSMDDSEEDIKNHSVSMGAICGINEGTIDGCDSISNRVTGKVRKYGYVSAAGIAGKAKNTKSKITKCTTDSNTIYAFCGTKSYALNGTDMRYAYHDSYAGGIVGKQMSGSIEDCIVKKESGDVQNNNTAGLGTTCTAYGREGDKGKMECHIGGISASKLAGATIKNCVVYKTTALQHSAGGIEVLDKHVDHIGLIVGSKAKQNENEIEKCYAETTDSMNVLADNATTDGDGVKALSSCRWSELSKISASIVSRNDSFKMGSDYYPQIVDNDLDTTNKSNYLFDSSEAKKVFFVGDSFKTGDIKLSTSLPDGTDYEVKDFTVDYSHFKNTTANTSTIYVDYRGMQWSYQVEIKEPTLSYIYVKTAPTKTEYIEGETFNSEGMDIYYVKDNGETNRVPADSYTVSCEEIVPGDNEVKISYNGMECFYYVVGQERTVKGIKVTKEPLKKEYTVGTLSLDMSGLEVEVSYEEGSKKTITDTDLNELEFVYSAISKGNNSISICYDAYYSDTVTVVGTYNVDQTVLSNYLTLVNSLDSIQDYNTLYKKIREAKALREQLGDYEDSDVKAADNKLNTLVSTFNEDVAAINKDFTYSIKVASSFDYTILGESVGFGASFSAVLFFVIKMILGA